MPSSSVINFVVGISWLPVSTEKDTLWSSPLEAYLITNQRRKIERWMVNYGLRCILLEMINRSEKLRVLPYKAEYTPYFLTGILEVAQEDQDIQRKVTVATIK